MTHRYRLEYVAGAGGLTSSVVALTLGGRRATQSVAVDARPRPPSRGAIELGTVDEGVGLWRRMIVAGWAPPFEELARRRVIR